MAKRNKDEEEGAGKVPRSAARAIEDAYRDVNIYGTVAEFREGLDRYPESVGHLLTVYWCDVEVCNGGFQQFFSNSTGILAPEAIKGYRALGLEDCATLVERAVSAFGRRYPRDRRERQDELALLAAKHPRGADLFDELDTAYYAANDRISVQAAMDRYAAGHLP